MRILFAMTLLLGAANSARAESTHYLDLVNTADSSIVAFAVAPAGTDRFHDISLGAEPLQGGGNSTTIAIDGDGNGCSRDLRATFIDGRVLIQRNFNVCKYRSYHTGQYLRRHKPMPAFAQP